MKDIALLIAGIGLVLLGLIGIFLIEGFIIKTLWNIIFINYPIGFKSGVAAAILADLFFWRIQASTK